MERSRKKVKFYFLFRLGSFLGYSVSESYSWLSLLSSVKSYFLDICSCWDSSRPSSGFGDETKQEQVCAFDSGLKSNNVWVVQKKVKLYFVIEEQPVLGKAVYLSHAFRVFFHLTLFLFSRIEGITWVDTWCGPSNAKFPANGQYTSPFSNSF